MLVTRERLPPSNETLWKHKTMAGTAKIATTALHRCESYVSYYTQSQVYLFDV